MLFMKINYTNILDRAQKSVRYHAFRSREIDLERKGMFNRTSDHADVRSFVASLDDPLTKDRTTRKGRLIQPPKMHRVMFTLSRREFEQCGFTSWKPVIREAMAAFEQQHRMRLDWVAAEHLSANHPHVHVDIKSVYTAPDGTRHRLVIRNEHRLAIRKSIEAIMDRERERVREERPLEREMDRAVHDLTRGLLRGLREIARADEAESDQISQSARRRRPRRERESEGRDR